MAKYEHEEEVTGGLTGGLSFGASKKAKSEKEGAQGGEKGTGAGAQQEDALISAYRMRKRRESKTAKLNILIKPSIAKKMDEAVDSNEIKSRNDLINTLLEQHFALDDAIKNGKIKTQGDLVSYIVNQYFPEA